jgi:hypothetical protein
MNYIAISYIYSVIMTSVVVLNVVAPLIVISFTVSVDLAFGGKTGFILGGKKKKKKKKKNLG